MTFDNFLISAGNWEAAVLSVNQAREMMTALRHFALFSSEVMFSPQLPAKADNVTVGFAYGFS